MSKYFKDFVTFMSFFLGFKLPKIAKKMTNEDLLELYYKFAPLYWNQNLPFENKVKGAVVVYIIGQEFKWRYPNNHNLQEWGYTEEINLYDTITGGK